MRSASRAARSCLSASGPRFVAATTRRSAVPPLAPRRAGCTRRASSTRSRWLCSSLRHLGDLVEEQRRAVGLADHAGALGHAGVRDSSRRCRTARRRSGRRETSLRCARRASCSLRDECAWIACAASSLPVPLSPSSSTCALERADEREHCSRSSHASGDSPTMPCASGSPNAPRSAVRRAEACAAGRHTGTSAGRRSRASRRRERSVSLSARLAVNEQRLLAEVLDGDAAGLGRRA